LSADTLVVIGGGDVQIGTLGLGLTKAHQAAILGGSFWQQVVNIDSQTKPPVDMSVRVNPHVVAGQSQAEGITFFSGLVMRWFRDAICDGMDYAELEAKAAQVPLGAYGILPIFSDAMHYGHWIHASPSFIGLGIDPEKYNKYSLFRSLEENAAIISGINFDEIIRFTDAKIDHVVFAGGAAKGILWPQIVADVLGLPLHIPEVTEATSLGCAICAGVGAGIWQNFDEAVQAVVKIARIVEPNKANFAAYQIIKQRWQKIYHAQLALVQQGLTEPMWKAPGL
jgi:autoinducer 2 (AI-2) kinase